MEGQLVMIPADETFDGRFPFAPHLSAAAGFKMHYVDEGEGEPIVCLHGEPTWGYLYRNFIPALARTHRVVVPDHMGFGKSETPQDRTYTLKTHVENLTALLDDLELHDITFVGQDWGGPITAAFTVRHPDRVKRICLMNTVLGYGGWESAGDLGASPWFQWIGQRLAEGNLEEVLGNLGSTILSVMKIIGFENSAAVDETWIRAYSAPFPTKADCKGAVEFPLDVALGRIAEYAAEGLEGVEALKQKPAMLIEGMRDRAIPAEIALADFRGLYPNGPVVTLDAAGHFIQEDAPEICVALIQQFLQMT
jgi:pimeloyl-ACP methyl ester carboxylesterase